MMAEQWLLKDGQPHAEIIIAEKPERAVDMGAEELQAYNRKISGATLYQLAATMIWALYA